MACVQAMTFAEGASSKHSAISAGVLSAGQIYQQVSDCPKMHYLTSFALLSWATSTPAMPASSFLCSLQTVNSPHCKHAEERLPDLCPFQQSDKRMNSLLVLSTLVTSAVKSEGLIELVGAQRKCHVYFTMSHRAPSWWGCNTHYVCFVQLACKQDDITLQVLQSASTRCCGIPSSCCFLTMLPMLLIHQQMPY